MPMGTVRYVKQNKLKNWNEEDMVKAIVAVIENKMGTLKAAKLLSDPRTTLQTLSKDNSLPPQQAASKRLGRHAVLADASEKMLVEYVLFMEAIYFGITIADLRCLAYQVDGIPHPFQTEEAGRAWADLFLQSHEALLSVVSQQLFEKLRSQMEPGWLNRKVIGISGDVSEPDLGLSSEDRKLIVEHVSIVFHAAATIRFDETLKKAVLLNARGTKLMLELAKEMKKLEAFVHVSTAYCHLQEKVLYERVYPPPADPHKIIRCVEWLDEDIVNSITKKILGNLPNTYAYTKALAEGLVTECMDSLPVIIVRPSIVIPVWKEPLPGWTDNINGPTGLLIGAGKGVIRTMYCNQDGYADYLPVDIAVNGIILATFNFVFMKAHDKRVYHLTSSSEFKISWAEIIERGRKASEKIPLNNIAWYPGGSMKKSRLYHNICVFFFHFLPACFIDLLIFLSGHKPIMLRIHRRIAKGFEVFEYYANNQWDFKNELVVEMRKSLNARERKEYKIDGEGLDIDDYFEDCIHAARLYILNEPLETLPRARRHMRIMYWVDVITKILFFGLLIWMVYSWSDNIMEIVQLFFNAVGRFFSFSLDTKPQTTINM